MLGELRGCRVCICSLVHSAYPLEAATPPIACLHSMDLWGGCVRYNVEVCLINCANYIYLRIFFFGSCRYETAAARTQSPMNRLPRRKLHLICGYCDGAAHDVSSNSLHWMRAKWFQYAYKFYTESVELFQLIVRQFPKCCWKLIEKRILPQFCWHLISIASTEIAITKWMRQNDHQCDYTLCYNVWVNFQIVPKNEIPIESMKKNVNFECHESDVSDTILDPGAQEYSKEGTKWRNEFEWLQQCDEWNRFQGNWIPRFLSYFST